MNTSFGETLRAAREAKGLTTSQVAAQTRMLVQIVEEMENEDFHRIAAPIYGRGFVRLFAECVGLDPIPLVKEFMDIYEGRRAPIVRTREVPVQPEPKPIPAPEPPPAPAPEPPPAPAPEPPPAPAPEPPPAPAPEPPSAPEPEPSPTVSEPPPLITPDLRQEPAPAPMPEPTPAPAAEQEPAPEPIPEPPPIVRGLDLFDAAAARAQPAPAAPAAPTAPAAPKAQPPAANVADIFSDSPYLSTESMRDAEGPSAAERFRTGLSSVSHGVIESVRDIPRSFWRIAALTVVGLVVIAFLAWGCVKLYQATSVTPTPPTQQHLDASDDAKGKDSKPAKVAQPPAKATQQAAKAPDKKPQPKAGKDAPKPVGKPAKRPPLRSTGQKIPPLYAD